MSIIFGVIREPSACVDEDELRLLSNPTARYAEEGTFLRSFGRGGMGMQPYSTHERGSLESQPVSDARGNIAVFDGRLDNFEDLCSLLGLDPDGRSDSEIVLVSFEHWGNGCFSRFVGDWAVAIWSKQEAALYLARDHAGTRTLYYSQTDRAIHFATHLETLLSLGHGPVFEELYAVRYLAALPTGDLTPYKNVTAVTPAHFLCFKARQQTSKAHWEWIAKDTIRYATDREYEEHFRELFARSVARRTGLGAPILAQLSGGMDSSSIVCMSDTMKRSAGVSRDDLLDTISYFDDTEPHWNERPYFTAIERDRGKVGFHIDASDRSLALEEYKHDDAIYWLPGTDRSSTRDAERFEDIVKPRGYKVLLSGVGGDEMLGGVPSVLPQLADCLVAANLRSFATLAIESCITTRRPLFEVMLESAVYPLRLFFRPETQPFHRVPPWLTHHAVRLLRHSVAPHPSVRFTFARPSAVASGASWWRLMETMPHLNPSPRSRLEYRYPYLDRDLVDFLHRIPAQQLVRPGRRRSLMRRALKGIVPIEVLERRRKGYISRSLGVSLADRSMELRERMSRSHLENYRLLDKGSLSQHLSPAISQEMEAWVPFITRAVLLEIFMCSWLGAA